MFAQYPYLNLNDFNLDYILNAIKDMRYEVTNFVSINAIKYADPIQWNITSQYEKNTIVIDPVTGTAYISVAPVPVGVALTRPEYWTVVFDLGSFVTRAAKNFTTRYEQDTTTTATFPTTTGEWLVWGDTLYVANVNITAGDSYVVDGNIRRITVEEVKNTIMQLIADNYDALIAMIGDLDDLTTTEKNNLVTAINELVSGLSDEVQARQDADDTINNTIGDLNDLTTTDKTSIVNAINEAVQAIGDISYPYITPEEYGAVGDGVTDDSAAFIAMFAAADPNTICIGSSENGYFINNSIPIENKSNVTIINCEFKLGVMSPSTWFEIKDSHYITFDGCTFNCNGMLQIIRLFTCDNIRVENCNFINGGYCVIQENGYTSDNVNVNKCRFTNCKGNINCNCGANNVSHNWVITENIASNDVNESAAAENFFVDITYVDNVVIADNIAINFRGGGIIMLERISDSVIISNNVLENCAGYSVIQIEHQGKETIITGNRINQNYSTPTTFIYIGNESDHLNAKCIIANNHFVGNGSTAAFRFSLANPSSPATYVPVLIDGNIIENIGQLFYAGLIIEMVKMSNNVISATTDCLNYSMSSADRTRLMRNCSFINNRFNGNVILDQNYNGAKLNNIIFDNNQFYGNVDIKRSQNVLFLNNILGYDFTYSFTTDTGCYTANNYQFGVGLLT